MMKRRSLASLYYGLMFLAAFPSFGQEIPTTVSYKRVANSAAQWYPKAGFGMFIHWGISSVKELDCSWPMRAGTQIGWNPNKPSQDSVDRYVKAGDFMAGHECKNNQNCITPNEYFALAKDFDPKNFDADKMIKAAKDAGMTYAVFTAKHHDGFALWPSAYGDYNTKNYLGGRDFVKEFVAACRKYGLKVGLYFSPPDWHFDEPFQNYLYYGLAKKYTNIPELDRNLQPKKNQATPAELQAHYERVAAFVKGQTEELLSNYGKIDVIWFDTDGVPIIPADNPAWKNCITMEQIRQLQPGIVVSPRLFGYGDYTTFEGPESKIPTTKQDGWAEYCTTIAANGTWGYTKSALKPTAQVLNNFIRSRAYNINMLLNYGPTKDGVFTPEMYKSLGETAGWMQQNSAAIKGTQGIDSTETASVPATQNKNHRYLFLLAPAENATAVNEKIVFTSHKKIKTVKLLGRKEQLVYRVDNGRLTIEVPAAIRSALPDVIDVRLK